MNIQKTLLLFMLPLASNAHGMNFARNGWQHTKNFFTTGQGFAKGMKKLTTATFFGITYGTFLLDCTELYENVAQDNIKNPIESEVQEFVQSTLKEYNFPKWVHTAPIAFFRQSGAGIDGKFIYVPFDAHELGIAKKIHCVKNITPQDVEQIRGLRRSDADAIYHMNDHLPEPLKRTVGELYGIAADKHTLNFWKNAIIHEGSHYLHGDPYRPVLFHALAPIIVHLGSNQIARFFISKCTPLRNIPSIIEGLSLLPLLGAKLKVNEYFGRSSDFCIQKYNEWRADQEIIKRVTDPEMLEANVAFFEKMAHVRDFDYEKQLNLLKTQKMSLQNNLQLISQLAQLHPDMFSEAQELEKEYKEVSKKEQALIKKMDRLKKYPWLEEFSHQHPRPEVRAAYFKKATEKLRKDQEQKV